MVARPPLGSPDRAVAQRDQIGLVIFFFQFAPQLGNIDAAIGLNSEESALRADHKPGVHVCQCRFPLINSSSADTIDLKNNATVVASSVT